MVKIITSKGWGVSGRYGGVELHDMEDQELEEGLGESSSSFSTSDSLSYSESPECYSAEADGESPAPRPKRSKYACSFRPGSNSYSWATVSRKGPSYALCTVCSRDVSVAYGGTKDLRRHEQTNLHRASSKSINTSSSLATFFSSKPGPKREQAVVEAEVKFAYFIGEHHLAINVADHCSQLFSSLFPDSTIARAFKCGRTKATAIMKVIAQEVMEDILLRLKESQFFSIHTDETTDIIVQQHCGIMLRFFDNTDGVVRCVFFKLEPVENADAEGLFQTIDHNFTSEGPLCYSKLVGMGSDGTNVMLGKRNSVLTRLKAKQPSLISFHCNCHLAALIANHACSVLPDYLEDLTISIWYYFQKSAKRQRLFKEFQQFVQCKPHKLLKAAQTRWLSLEACVQRLLEQYDALLSYFRSTEETSAQVRRITDTLEKEISKLYLMFLNDALPVINIFNKLMQKQSPTVHILHREVNTFVKKLLLRFIKPNVVQSTKISEIDLDDARNYTELEEVFIGDKAKRYSEESDLATSDIRAFKETCRKFWIVATKYAISNLPIKNEFLLKLNWLYPNVYDYSNISNVLHVASNLPQVISEVEKPLLREEFMDYCMSKLPQSFSSSEMSIDSYWHKVGEIKDDSELKYPILTKLAKSVLIIPHGNADIERLFSHMGLNKTKLRNSLGVETLTALLQLQFNVKEPCYKFKPTKQVLTRCRNAVSSLNTE